MDKSIYNCSMSELQSAKDLLRNDIAEAERILSSIKNSISNYEKEAVKNTEYGQLKFFCLNASKDLKRDFQSKLKSLRIIQKTLKNEIADRVTEDRLYAKSLMTYRTWEDLK